MFFHLNNCTTRAMSARCAVGLRTCDDCANHFAPAKTTKVVMLQFFILKYKLKTVEIQIITARKTSHPRSRDFGKIASRSLKCTI